MKRFLITIIISLSLAGAAGCEALTPSGELAGLEASGIIEATEVAVAAEMAGRAVEVNAAEGDPVAAGALLVRLDASLYRVQRQAAAAALATANKGVQSAQAALETARGQYEMTLSAALSAEEQMRTAAWARSELQEFELPAWYYSKDERSAAASQAVEEARIDLEAAQNSLALTLREPEREPFLRAEMELAKARTTFEIAAALLEKASADPTKPELEAAAQEVYDEALDRLEDAQKAYADFLSSEEAQEVLNARAEAAIAQERYDMAMDWVRALQTGAIAPTVVAAESVVRQAQAALEQSQAAADQAQAELDLLDAQMARLEVHAPLAGVVLARVIQPGEIVQAGMTLMTIANLQNLTVTVYIPENRYGEIRLGDEASLRVDSFPGETFTATVTRIADQAEFTPRNVQTKEERQTTVFAVALTIENPDGALKPGMPADVVFP